MKQKNIPLDFENQKAPEYIKGIDLTPHKTIRIAVSGDVLLNKMETEIINTPDFQRLRKLKQLGSTNVVFPTAIHTRFDHSLGTLSMTCEMIRCIEENLHNEQEEREISDDQKQLARLLALLHDIGHMPYGHTIEDEFGIFPRHDEDTNRIDGFIGRESEIGKIICKFIDEDFFNKFYKMITVKKENLFDLGNDLFIYDLVNNTVCADLLDYLRRDCFFCNLPIGLDYRFMRFMYIYNHTHIVKDEKGNEKKRIQCKRIAIRLWKKNQTKPRTDLLNELVSLLEYRYKLGEIAYFHHTKIISGTMIAGAVMRAKNIGYLKASDLYRMGDEELIIKLKTSKDKKIVELATAFDQRKLWKLIYEKDRRTVDAEQDGNRNLAYLENFKKAFYSNPQNRYNTEKQISEHLGMEDGDVLIHCPDFKMQMKYAQMNVFWNGEFQTLWDCHDETLIHNKLDLILKSHQNLWAARVCVNPLYQDKKEEIQNACEYSFSFNGDEKKRYEKTHYNHVVKNIITASIDASSITHEQYSEIKKESIKRILEPTNINREIISLNKIVSDVIKEKNSNAKQQ